MKKKMLLTILAMVLVCVLSVTGTLAYLTFTTPEVKNTFTAGDVVPENGFSLDEPDPDDDDIPEDTTIVNNQNNGKDYTNVLPGTTLPKKANLKITKLGAKAYLFVEVLDNLPTDTAGNKSITWTVAEGWQVLKNGSADVNGPHNGKVYVYYKDTADTTTSLPKSDAEQTVAIIGGEDGKELTVTGTYAGSTDAANPDSLSFYGYLCQAAGFTGAADAWANCFATP